MKAVGISLGHVAHVWGERSLDDIATRLGRLGYEGVEFFDHQVADFLDRPVALRELLSRCGLRLASVYLEGSFMVTERKDADVERAARWAAFVAELGCRQLVIGPGWRREMSDAERYDVLCETVTRMGRRTVEFGVQASFHPHVGSAVETHEQIARVFDATDPATLSFCLDTGHVAKARNEILEQLATYRHRTPYVHLKDVEAQVRFVELGTGRLNLPAFFRDPRDSGYAGCLLPEVPVSAATAPTPAALAAHDPACLRDQLVRLSTRDR